MKLSSLFIKNKPTFSFEVFPPKKTSSVDSVKNAVGEIAALKPDYMSVTYGAGGSSASDFTLDIAELIKNEYGIEAITHLTCVNNTREEVSLTLEKFRNSGIENILALRGDINPEVPPKNDFRYASELVEFIKKSGDFTVAGACYPEGHIECESTTADILNLKKKVDAGADCLISQLFFDNSYFYKFIERAQIAGINVPIEAGIMPVVNKNQIERMVTMCGASLPPKFTKIMSRYENNPEALRDAGIAYAVDQIVDLVSSGVDGIHLYTMNNPYLARRISESVSGIIRA